MRYSLLDLICCPFTHEKFALVVFKEILSQIPHVYISAATRTNRAEGIIGPIPSDFYETEFHKVLRKFSTDSDAVEKNFSHSIEEGLLISISSGKWYPIQNGIPIIYPDNLRNWTEDIAYLEKHENILPAEIYKALYRPDGKLNLDTSGDSFKRSEIDLLNKVDDKSAFLGPGYVSPFNWGSYEHSASLIKAFSICLPLLKIQRGDFVLDSGSGYSWTTEWMQKMGINSIGIDINRTYLDVGRARMGAIAPHMIVCDVENLPILSGTMNSVLGFDGFHHVPNRVRAMQQYERILKKNGSIVLVEPGEDHFENETSQEVMEKYGILEKGMTLRDVNEYIADAPFLSNLQEHFIGPYGELNEKNRDYLGWSLFSITKI